MSWLIVFVRSWLIVFWQGIIHCIVAGLDSLYRGKFRLIVLWQVLTYCIVSGLDSLYRGRFWLIVLWRVMTHCILAGHNSLFGRFWLIVLCQVLTRYLVAPLDSLYCGRFWLIVLWQVWRRRLPAPGSLRRVQRTQLRLRTNRNIKVNGKKRPGPEICLSGRTDKQILAPEDTNHAEGLTDRYEK